MRNIFCVLLALFVLSNEAHSHARGENYVFLDFYQSHLNLEFQIHYEDLEKIGVEVNQSQLSVMDVVELNREKMDGYIRENFSVYGKSDVEYEMKFVESKLLQEHPFVGYVYRIDTGETPDILSFQHSILRDIDARHRGLLLVRYNEREQKDYGEQRIALSFGPSGAKQSLDIDNIPSLLGVKGMLYQGMLHIWGGLDHVLFLLALLLPTVLVFGSGVTKPAETFHRPFLQLMKIVTVFTLAHSVTLVLAGLNIISLNSRFVESIIALSIILVAVNNATYSSSRNSLWIISVLGLFHGLGFATVMAELPFRMVNLYQMVISFNIGVELGQIVLVALIFPILFALRKSRYYQPLVLRGGSILLILIASFWFYERAIQG